MGWVLVGVVVVVLVALALRSARAAHVPEAAAQTAPAGAPAVRAAGGIPEETVAVISAAIAAYMAQSSPGVPYAITGITRSNQSRPVWGFAGMRQNTRPF